MPEEAVQEPMVDVEVISDLPFDSGETKREVVVREVRQEVLRSLPPDQLVESMRQHQNLLRQILDPTDWQGPPDGKQSFVKKSGWRKIALAYNLTIERVSEQVDRDLDGMPVRASYTARSVAPTGRSVEATGHCAYSESRFSGPRGNTAKLENDMRATAETRAKNRAISDLVGMGKVSAEEAQAAPEFGNAASAAQMTAASNAMRWLVEVAGITDDEDQLVINFLSAIDGHYGYIPQVSLSGLMFAARDLKDKQTPEAAPIEEETESVDPVE